VAGRGDGLIDFLLRGRSRDRTTGWLVLEGNSKLSKAGEDDISSIEDILEVGGY
jgi:hypothetical protein